MGPGGKIKNQFMKGLKYKITVFMALGFVLNPSLIFGQEKSRQAKIKQSEVFAQKAGESLANNDFAQAEANYRQAVAADPDNSVANYNFGNLYYGKKLKNESSAQLGNASKSTEDKALLHRIFHNQGNILMDKKQYAKAVEAYKNALRKDPTDDETRYNLAIAKEKLKKKRKKQKKQNKKNKDDKKKNKKNDKKKKKKQDENKKGYKGKKDKKKKNDKKKGGKKKDDKKNKGKEKKKDQKKKDGKSKKDQERKKKQGKPQKVKGRLSKQQAKNLLQAIQNQEEKTRKKVNAKKTRGRQKNLEKDW